MRRAAPSHRERAVDHAADFRFRAIAQRREIGNQSDEPEQQRHRRVCRDREDVPDERAAELRPHVHRVRIREQPVDREPRTSRVQHREYRRAGDGEQRHRFGEAIDRGAPCLLEEQQDRRDERARVADADPPHEVDNREAPADRNVDAPYARAHEQQVGDGDHEHVDERERDAEAEPPSERRPARQDDRADLVGDGREGMARRDDRRTRPRRRRRVRFLRRRSGLRHLSSGLSSVMAARYVVLGLVFSSCSRAYSRCFGLQRRDAALRIVQVAEDDRFGRADRLARGLHFAVLNAAAVLLGFDARGADALHAIRALLHDAAAADRHIGIASDRQARRLPILVLEEVEPAHFVRTVVRAVARADAAVVDHVVQPFAAVHGRADRTDGLARRGLAVHARNGLEVGLRILDVALMVGVDAQPVHLAAAHHFVFADDGNVVLRLARDDARVAAVARVEIDRHAPLVAAGFFLLVGEHRPQRRQFVLVFLQRCELSTWHGAHEIAPFHQVVVLHARERKRVAGQSDLRAGPEPECIRRSQRPGVETAARLRPVPSACGRNRGAASPRRRDDRRPETSCRCTVRPRYRISTTEP